MKNITITITIIAALLSAASCRKDGTADSFIGYEVVMTYSDGTVYRSSEIYKDEGKIDVSENIYLEKGVFWVKREDADGVLPDANGFLEENLEENSKGIDMDISLVPYPYGGADISSDGAEKVYHFSQQEVEDFAAAVRECFSSIKKFYLKGALDDCENSLDKFVKNPGTETYRSALESIMIIDFLTIGWGSLTMEKDEGKDKVTVGIQLFMVCVIYDGIFSKAE